MQSVLSRIWTRVAVSISYDDNHYTTGTFLLVVCYIVSNKTTVFLSVYSISVFWYFLQWERGGYECLETFAPPKNWNEEKICNTKSFRGKGWKGTEKREEARRGGRAETGQDPSEEERTKIGKRKNKFQLLSLMWTYTHGLKNVQSREYSFNFTLTQIDSERESRIHPLVWRQSTLHIGHIRKYYIYIQIYASKYLKITRRDTSEKSK